MSDLGTYVCVTCGAQYPPATEAPSHCTICEDERQYTRAAGQEWTPRRMMADTHTNVWKEEEPGVMGIGTEPSFAIGQRALLIQTGAGNLLWDCINCLTADTISRIRELGGIQAIAISHPHFYTGMADWAQEFDCPVYMHEKDRQWVTQPTEHIKFWTGDKLRLFDAVTVVRLGGHFPGSSVLHWEEGCDGRGILCTGDTIQAIPAKGWVSFMYSYPNLMPLPASEVARMRDEVKKWPFERLYGGWFGRTVASDAQSAVVRSANRYIGLLDGSLKREYF